mmetsp:Transcript_80187/g.202818  ORF Transcript_80187/g.202818 Transcript_80187/m.202818 type:complete len:663 (-) Transcript_80187:627-2615(-)
MAVCDIEVDICTLKQHRANLRVRDIAVKRAEYQRARSVPRSQSSAPADRVKPHRIARTVTRSFVAKGLVQGAADMPSITSMERSTSAHARKKPSVAAMVSCGANPFFEESSIPLSECSQAEVVAFLGKNLKKSVVKVPGLGPLASDRSCGAERMNLGVEGSVVAVEESNCVELKLEHEQAAEQGKDNNMAMAVFDPGFDICSLKMRRAESRKRHIAAKRMEYQIARTTPRARSSDPADRVKPHRIARSAARSFVAKGFVEGESDMPSLTSMGKPTSAHARKKPSVASLVQCSLAPCFEKTAYPLSDFSDFETTASEGEDSSEAILRPWASSDVDVAVESKPALDDENNARELETLHFDEHDRRVESQSKQDMDSISAVIHKSERGAKDADDKHNEASTHDDLHSMRVRAEVESRVIKSRAEMEARALKAAMEAEQRAQAHEKAQAEERARAELAARERAAREARRRAEIAQQREASAALKRAKELEQQRARQFRKQEQQERKLAQMKEQELEAARVKAKEESDALRARALAEVNALKATAEAEARDIRARAMADAIAKAMEESQAQFEMEAHQARQESQRIVQQEPELEPNQNEAKVDRVRDLSDLEIQDGDGVDGDMLADIGIAHSTEPEPEESGWEVLPTAETCPSGSCKSSKGWWNIFF